MLKVTNISKKFETVDTNKKKKIFYADNDVSFTANDSEIVGILGPNGAGKTTLLRIVAGILTADNGTINYDNLDLKKDILKIKKNLAYLSGNTKIYNSLTTYELLYMCAEFYDVPKDKIAERINEVADILNIKEFINKRIGHLSTGQTQRVNIARCLIHNPKYYILDFIKNEKEKGKTILYSTHYMEEAENICDKIVMLNKGKVVYTGTPDEIKKKTKTTNLRDAFFKVIGDDHE